MKNLTKLMCFFSFLTVTALSVFSQGVSQPRVSQQATVSQRIGLTDVTIMYHSPAVKDRKIWGALVPFGQVWRAGANENTIISFSDPVTIEGEELDAGSYGLYMKPHANSVDVIFSSATKNWGTVSPTEDQIVATVSVSPQTSPHREWLTYDFMDRGGNDVIVALKWSTWTIPFKIEVDVKNLVLDNIRAELNGIAGFGYLGKEQAARYCLLNDVALDEGMTWIDQSISSEKRFTNLSIKSGLLKKLGKEEEANKVFEEALSIATPVQVNIFGYQLLNSGDVKGATKIFLKNINQTPETHPFYWGFIDSVGEAYLKNGDKKNALKYYKMAKKFAPSDRQGYLDGVINGILEKP